jgi:hypothetical protein
MTITKIGETRMNAKTDKPRSNNLLINTYCSHNLLVSIYHSLLVGVGVAWELRPFGLSISPHLKANSFNAQAPMLPKMMLDK